MKDMFIMNATDVRKDWSSVAESVIHEKPAFIKRTRDKMALMNLQMLEGVLAPYTFTACRSVENDGSITFSLNAIDLVENGRTEQEARLTLAAAILEYAEDYYNEFSKWSAAPNRKAHIPYVLKALIVDDINKIGDLIQCQAGEN